MIQPKVKPKMRTLTVSLPESKLAALDEYCRFLGGDTDRTYIVSEALLQVISRDKRFKNGQEPIAGPRSAQTAGASPVRGDAHAIPLPHAKPGRPNHVADFEVVFKEGALCSLKLVGGSLWCSRLREAGPDRLFVTLPARHLRGPFFDLLRSAGWDRNIIRDFKARVVSEYHAHERDEDQARPRAASSCRMS